MIKHFLLFNLFTLILLFPFTTLAQEAEISKEIAKYEKKLEASKSLEAKVDTLNELIIFLVDNNEEEEAKKRAKEALKMAEKASYYSGKGRVLTHLGDIAINQQDYPKAQTYYEEAQKVHKIAKDQNGEAYAWSGVGLSFYYQSEYGKSLGSYKKALKIFERVDNEVGKTEVLPRLGATYNALANYDEALKYYLQALKVNEEIKDLYDDSEEDYEIALVTSNIGIVYKQLKNLDKAILYFKQSLQISEKIDYEFGIGASLTNLGAVYDDLKNYNKSLNHYKKALKIFEGLENIAAQSAILNNMGDVYRKTKNYEKALELHLQALEIKKEIGDKKGEAILNHGIAQVYFAQKDFGNARVYWNRALRLATEIGHRETQKDAYQGIAQVFIETKEYEKAYPYFERYTQVKDSLLNAETIDKIASLRSMYHVEKEEQKIEKELLQDELNKTKKSSQFNFILSLILALLVLILIVLLILVYRKKTKQSDKTDEVIEAQIPTKATEIPQKEEQSIHTKSDLSLDTFWQHFQESNFAKAKLGIQEHCQDYFNIFISGKPKQNFLWWFENEKARFLIFANYLGTEKQNLLTYTWSDKILYQLIQDELIASPAEVLSNWDIRLQTHFRRAEIDDTNWEGIACSVLCWTKEDNKLIIANSKKELFYTDKGQIKSLQGLEIGIGFMEYYEAKNFENQFLSLDKGEEIFLLSQNVYEDLGENESLKELLSDLQALDKSTQKERLQELISKTENESWILGIYL